MSVYYVELSSRVCVKCGKKATHRVVNSMSGTIGEFCLRCAKAMTTKLNQEADKR